MRLYSKMLLKKLRWIGLVCPISVPLRWCAGTAIRGVSLGVDSRAFGGGCTVSCETMRCCKEIDCLTQPSTAA